MSHQHRTYSVVAPTDALQKVCDALNNPRSTSDDYDGPLGLGPSTCREDASTYPALADADGDVQTVTARRFTLPVPLQDVARFEDIADDVDGVEYAVTHPDDANDNYESPREHYADLGYQPADVEKSI